MLTELETWVGSVDGLKDWQLANEPQQVRELRGWIAQLELGKAWLENQVTSWRQEAEKRGAQIEELRDWIEQLEAGKAWLEEQAVSWQKEAEAHRTEIGRLQGWVAKQEAAKSWVKDRLRSQQRGVSGLGRNPGRASRTSPDRLRATITAFSRFIQRIKAGLRR